ncbi:MAG: arsenate reductase ArsC [Alcanivoracaceae bacterium]|nr:arsenate reductase ArsC [Alcanivoracaceae bacterium]
MQLPVRILFLCTGNSCRSIIAEALANHLGEGRLLAFSAGSFPTGKVNENAVAILEKHGIPLPPLKSQSWDDYEGQPVDLVITVCDAAAGESCPVWMGDALKAHWGVPDPADVEGTDEDIERAFDTTYMQMHARLDAMLTLPLTTMSEAELTAALGDIQHRFSTTN